MIDHRCHACHRVNPADADCCAACGTELEAVVTQPQPLHGFDNRASSGAIWLDDLTPSQAQGEPAPAAAAVPEALPELAITLLDVEAGARVSAQWVVEPALPRAEALRLSDHEPRLRLVAAPAAAEVPCQSAEPTTVRAHRKAERRAAVRKSRLRSKPAAGAVSTASEVLVFDPHDGDRDRLRNLLRDFGFCVHAAGCADEARALAAAHTLVAAFVDVALDAADGGAGLDLCQQLRAAGHCRDGNHTLLVLTAAHLQPMDRVRAELAGCEETIAKPLTRGSIARVLDSRGIALPIDRRRG